MVRPVPSASLGRVRRPTPALCLLALLAVGACGEGSPGLANEAGTVGNVGQLPADFRPPTASTSPPPLDRVDDAGAGAGEQESETTVESSEPSATTESSATAADRPLRSFGRAADGNRLLAIGDSITQAVGPEYGGQLCVDLEERGWYVGVDAEQGRDVAEAADALDDQLDDGEWDAVVINAGSNYRGEIADYIRELEAMLARVGDRPVLLVTVTEWEPEISAVNDVLQWVAAPEDDQVWLVDWAARTESDDSLTGDDGLHLSEIGRERLATLIARAVGSAPRGGEAGCDDLLDGPTGDGQGD